MVDTTKRRKQGQWIGEEVCLACRTQDHPYCRNGMCVMCIFETQKKMASTKGVRKSGRMRCNYLTKECEVQCLACRKWQPIGFFNYNPKTMQIGKHGSCCLGKSRKEFRESGRRRAYERERAAQRAIDDRKADAEYAAWKKQFAKGAETIIPLEGILHIVLDWIATVEKRCPTQELVQSHTGIPHRRLASIKNAEQNHVTVGILERLADYVGGDMELIIPTGVDGWGPNGERHCEDCGSWFHRHYAKGRDLNCYNNYLRRGKEPYVEYWAPRHKLHKCVKCGLNASHGRKHKARGMCNPCLRAEYAAEDKTYWQAWRSDQERESA